MATERSINMRAEERAVANEQRLARIEAKLDAIALTLAEKQAPAPEAPRPAVAPDVHYRTEVRNAKK